MFSRTQNGIQKTTSKTYLAKTFRICASSIEHSYKTTMNKDNPAFGYRTTAHMNAHNMFPPCVAASKARGRENSFTLVTGANVILMNLSRHSRVRELKNATTKNQAVQIVTSRKSSRNNDDMKRNCDKRCLEAISRTFCKRRPILC